MTESASIEGIYHRSYGVYQTELTDGTSVSSLSFPSWDEFHIALSSLPETTGYVISPELITSPVPLTQIPGMSEVVRSRVEMVEETSNDHPRATFLLGTSSTDELGITRNSLAVVEKGRTVGHVDKRGWMWPHELDVFNRFPIRSQAKLREIGHSALICLDIASAARWGMHPVQ